MVTIQGSINTGPEDTIDYQKYYAYLEEIVKKGFKKTLVEDLKYQDQVKLIIETDGKEFFRSGGWFIKMNDDEDDEKRWILIKSHKGPNFTVPIDNVVEVYALPKSEQKSVSIYDTPDPEKKYKLFIGDKLVYSSNLSSRIKRAMETEKYKNAVKTGNFKIK